MDAKMRILSNLEPSGSRVVTVDSVMAKVVDCGVKAVPVNPISVVQGRFSRRDVAQVAEVVKTYEYGSLVPQILSGQISPRPPLPNFSWSNSRTCPVPTSA